MCGGIWRLGSSQLPTCWRWLCECMEKYKMFMQQTKLKSQIRWRVHHNLLGNWRLERPSWKKIQCEGTQLDKNRSKTNHVYHSLGGCACMRQPYILSNISSPPGARRWSGAKSKERRDINPVWSIIDTVYKFPPLNPDLGWQSKREWLAVDITPTTVQCVLVVSRSESTTPSFDSPMVFSQKYCF